MIFVVPRFSRQIFLFVLVGIGAQYLITYIIWTSVCTCLTDTKSDVYVPRLKSGKVVCIFREFDPEANSLRSLVTSFAAHSAVERVLIVSDKKPYPPLQVDYFKAVLYELEPSVSPEAARKPLSSFLTSEWVAFVPDMVSFDPSSFGLYKFVEEATDDREASRNKIFVVKIKGKRVSCFTAVYAHREWTLYLNSSTGPVCDGVTGSAVYLIKTADLLSLSVPFGVPVDESLLIQGVVRGWKTRILRGATPFSRSEALLDPQIIRRLHESRDEVVKKLYERLGVKRIVKNGGEEIYGCSKTLPRCFGTIVNDTPSYLYEGRFTPPCCVRALRSTLAHVVEVFNNNGVRYWLEGGGLLGAARNGQLIPWDYDADLGIYLNDTGKVQYLEAAKQGPVVDPEGFVWELSQPHEGQFFRVQYSRTNRIHVDIFPFYSNNSIMTKDFWFDDHPQDREFPEDFLVPVKSIQFMGLTVPAPNSVKKFLELKFGTECIENPRPPHGIVF